MIITTFHLQGLKPDVSLNVHPNLTDVHKIIIGKEIHFLAEGGQGPTEEDSYQPLLVGFISNQHQLVPPPVQVVEKWFIRILGDTFQLIHADRLSSFRCELFQESMG